MMMGCVWVWDTEKDGDNRREHYHTNYKNIKMKIKKYIHIRILYIYR